jgi:hypothetical protein
MTVTKIRNILIGITLAVVLLLLAFCSDLTKPQYYELTQHELTELTEKRRDAYDYAMQCSGIDIPKVPFDKLGWVLMPGSVLQIDAVDGRATLKGFFNPTDSTIYMPFTERDTYWILAHESLHAIGVIGHPRIPFETPCRLMAEQHP